MEEINMGQRSGSHHAMPEELSKDVEKIKDALSQTVNDVKERAEDFMQKSFQDVKDKSNDWEKTVSKYIKENPIRAMGYSVLAGMFAAWLLRK
jgi:ElaB/YqjD/DUF883 family membrane-anchored ribosome-binding protein